MLVAFHDVWKPARCKTSLRFQIRFYSKLDPHLRVAPSRKQYPKIEACKIASFGSIRVKLTAGFAIRRVRFRSENVRCRILKQFYTKWHQ